MTITYTGQFVASYTCTVIMYSVLSHDNHMQAQNIIVTGTSKPDDLVKLLSALQASLLIWCQRMFKASEEEEVKKTVYNLLAECECAFLC